MFANDPHITCPKIHWNLTSPRVITMELIEGIKINDYEGLKAMNISKDQVSHILSECYGKQIFIDGFIHCDPHPGNILVRRKDQVQLVFLDHGLYHKLDPVLRLHYASLFKSIITLEPLNVKYYARKFTSLHDVNHKILATMLISRAWDENLNIIGLPNDISKQESKFLNEFLITNYDQIMMILSTLSTDLLLLMKTNELLRSIMSSSHYFAKFAAYSEKALAQYRIEITRDKNNSWWHIIRSHIKNVNEYIKLWLLIMWGRAWYHLKGDPYSKIV
jgi:aarF domain-containing kinase